MAELTHFDKDGRAQMVDVSEKADSVRRAVAEGRVVFSKDAYQLVREEGR